MKAFELNLSSGEVLQGVCFDDGVCAVRFPANVEPVGGPMLEAHSYAAVAGVGLNRGGVGIFSSVEVLERAYPGCPILWSGLGLAVTG